MKIEKITNNGFMFFYNYFYNHKKYIPHGLYNKDNKNIGYLYQSKMKGFWLKLY